MTTTRTWLTALIVLCTFILVAKTESPVSKGGSSIAFTENKGQVSDQFLKSRPDVLYGVTVGHLAVHIRKTGVSYQLARVDKWKDMLLHPLKKQTVKDIDQETTYRIDLEWLNANKNITHKGDKVLPGYTNYYRETCPDGALFVKSYSGITLQNIYNGVDVHYYERNGNLKHDYIVAPYTDYKKIQIAVRGAKIVVKEDGSLLLITPLEDVQECAPLVFQRGKQLKSRWVVKNNVLSFDIEGYDKSYALVIDPITRLWGTFYGGNNTEVANGTDTDAAGNVFLVGATNSNGTLIATSGSHQSIRGGPSNVSSTDAMLIKFDADGVRLWGTYYGGAGSDYGQWCEVDGSGNVFICGLATATSAIATSGSHQPNMAGGSYDAFLAKFDNAGVRQWGTYYGGSGFEIGFTTSLDGFGNIFMTGYTSSTNGTLATSGSHQPASGGGLEAFIVKFNTSGVRQWASFYGGGGSDYAYGCASDNSGNVYIAGTTNTGTANVIATAASHQTAYSGNYDAYLVKFDANGSRLWGTYYGDYAGDGSSGCTVDASGNVYLVGGTNSVSASGTAIATSSGHQTLYGGGNTDGFIAKFNSNGVRLWGTYYGGQYEDDAAKCVIDPSGMLYVVGSSNSTVTSAISTSVSYQATNGGQEDAFLAIFNSNGSRQWATYYGGLGDDNGYACAVDPNGAFYVAGQTASATGTVAPTSTAIASSDGHQPIYSQGLSKAFLAKFRDCPILSPVAAGTPTFCSGANISLSVTSSYTPNITYRWRGPNTYSSTSQNPVVSSAGFVNAGVYTVTIFHTGCKESATIQVQNADPTITATSGSVCSGNSFTIAGSGASTYTYSGGQIVTPSVTTAYSVTGTSSAGCVSSNTAISTVTVYTTPTIAVNSATICSGNTFSINPMGAFTYSIEGGLSLVSPSVTTSYSIIGVSAEGCVSSNTVTSNVFVKPSPHISVNSGTICMGKTFIITPTGALTYSIQGGIAAVSPSVTTNYTVIGTNSVGCVSQSAAISQIVVNPLPVITATSLPDRLCIGEQAIIIAGGASSYTITGYGTVSSVTVTPTVTTTYSINGIGANGCFGSTSITLTVDVCEGLAERQFAAIPRIFPNPAEDRLNVALASEGLVEIVNLIGQIVYSQIHSEGVHSIDVVTLPNGVYFLRIKGAAIKFLMN